MSNKPNEKSIATFLRRLYTDDPLIANFRVLQLIKHNFPASRATSAAVSSWKSSLRRQGIAIPFQRKRA